MHVKHETTSEKVIEIMDEKPVKKVCDGECDCKECDDNHGDNIVW